MLITRVCPAKPAAIVVVADLPYHGAVGVHSTPNGKLPDQRATSGVSVIATPTSLDGTMMPKLVNAVYNKRGLYRSWSGQPVNPGLMGEQTIASCLWTSKCGL